MDSTTFNTLVEYFKRLPGVGNKTAERYAYYIIEKMNDQDAEKFADSIKNIKKYIHKCHICGMLTESEICHICDNPSRDHEKILIVKDTKEVITLEKANLYHGLYHVLGNLISPINGIGPSDINIDSLIERVQNKNVELILATPFTPDGETTALFIQNIFKNKDNVKISKIGFGLPAFGDIEYADELTLNKALEKRETIK